MDQISFPEEKKKKTNFAAEHFESSHAFSHLVTILVRTNGKKQLNSFVKHGKSSFNFSRVIKHAVKRRDWQDFNANSTNN